MQWTLALISRNKLIFLGNAFRVMVEMARLLELSSSDLAIPIEVN